MQLEPPSADDTMDWVGREHQWPQGKGGNEEVGQGQEHHVVGATGV